MLPRQLGALVHKGDGWVHAERAAPAAPAALLVLVDPPFERGDDCELAARLTARVLAVNRGAVIAVWVPIKDLATFDAFLGEMEDAATGAPILAAEVRLRPLDDPMRLNGCALVVVNACLASKTMPALSWDGSPRPWARAVRRGAYDAASVGGR